MSNSYDSNIATNTAPAWPGATQADTSAAPGYALFPSDVANFWNNTPRNEVLTRDFLFGLQTIGHYSGVDEDGKPTNIVLSQEPRVASMLPLGIRAESPDPADPNRSWGFAPGADGAPTENGWWGLAILTQMPPAELRKLTQDDLNTVISFGGGRSVTFFDLLLQFSPSSIKELNPDVRDKQQYVGANENPDHAPTFAELYAAVTEQYLANTKHPPRDFIDRPKADATAR
jgi:hypothetical protein